MSDAPTKALRPPGPPLVEIALGLSWLLGTAAVLQAGEIALGRYVMAAAILGAVIADIASTLAGVRWDEGPRRDLRDALRSFGAGAAVATGVIAATLAVAAVLGGVDVTRGAPSWGVLLVLLRSVAVALRDELVFRGIPLVAGARAGVPPLAARAFAALAGAASIALLPGANVASIALSASTGWLFATLWQYDRGAYAAVAAHAAWALVSGALLRGGVLDVVFRQGNFVLGPRASGVPAWIAAIVALGAAMILPRLPGFRSARSSR